MNSKHSWYLQLLTLCQAVTALTDFTLSCQRGYRVTGIRRLNSPRQVGAAGSLSIECQSILETDLDTITCQTLASTPQCNGELEGCAGNQWLAGFHAYAIENSTNTVLGMQCWHQYNVNSTLVDLVWKLEICQTQNLDGFSMDQGHMESCPPCECHCGIDTCGDGKEPIRVVHKHINADNCGCDCLCRYECI